MLSRSPSRTGEISRAVRGGILELITEFSALTIVRFLRNFLLFVTMAIIARRLGVAVFGELSYVLAIVLVLQVFSGLGLKDLFVRDAAIAPECAPDYLSNILLIRTLCSVVCYAGVLGVAMLPSGTQSHSSILLIAGLTLFPVNWADSIEAVFISRQRIRTISLLQGGWGILRSGLALTALYMFGSLRAVVGGFLIGDLVYGLGSYWLLGRKVFHPCWKFNAALCRNLLRQALPMVIWIGLYTAYTRTDILLLGWFKDAHQIGLYNSGYQLITAAWLIPQSLMVVLTSPLARLFNRNREEFAQLYTSLFKCFVLGFFLIGSVFVIFAPTILHRIYLLDNAESVRTFRILSVGLPVSTLPFLLGIIMIILGSQKKAAWFTGTQLASNVLGNLIAIPLWGIRGASLVRIGSDLVGSALFFLYSEKKMEAPRLTSFVLRTAACIVLAEICLISFPGLQGQVGIIMIGGFISLTARGGFLTERERGSLESLLRQFRPASEVVATS